MDRSEIAYLVALDASLSSREFPLDRERLLIGRDGRQCDIVAAGATISRQHACVQKTDEGVCEIMDLESLNGLFVNGDRVDKKVVLKDNDLISLGSPDIFHLRYQYTSSRHKAWTSTLEPAEAWTIGRDNANDISLPFEAVVSSNHAFLRSVRGKLILTDLDSLNGTWVNGVKVRKSQIYPADTVVIGSTYFHFTLLPDGFLEINRREGGDAVQLECVNLSFAVRKGGGQTRVILDEITLSLEPGEFVGILGPSGAGKSTLLKALNGYLPPSSGTVLLNETSLYQTYQMFRNAIGYVPQDDILHQELSVEKSLEYLARLRLPRDLSAIERKNIVDSTIEALGLTHVRQQEIAQLSGGQRKRVSIGAELLTKPSILFLDEPTAGLDPSVEERIMQHFKKMTHNGTTILITTHILYSLDLLDRVIILSQGKLVFFGKPGEAQAFFTKDGQKIERPTQIFDVLEQVSKTGQTSSSSKSDLCRKREVADLYMKQYAESTYRRQHVNQHQTDTAREYAEARGKGISDRVPRKRTKKRSLLGGIFPWRDGLILTSRQMRLRIGSARRAVLYAVIPLLLALVTMSQQVPGVKDDVEYQKEHRSFVEQLQGIPGHVSQVLKSILSPEGEKDSRGLADVMFAMKYEGVQNLPLPMSVMLMCIMTAVFLGTINTCLEVSTEKTIYQRERMSSLRIADYLFSKLPLVFMVTMMQIGMFLLLLYLHPSFRAIPLLSVWVVLVTVSWSSAVLGLLVSTLDPTRGQLSVIFAIAVVLPQLILSGGLGPDYYQGLNTGTQYIAGCLPAKWGLEMLFTALYNDMNSASVQWIEQFVQNDIGFAFGENVVLHSMLALLIQAAAWLGLCSWILKCKDTIKL
ncbi:MAG: hypothetical protein CSA20_08050 [Deltaproteobacteria bacterium]|nr:MAG: hypothetical protein CSA20_08050 [Deltaproteobacteria bacterium]